MEVGGTVVFVHWGVAVVVAAGGNARIGVVVATFVTMGGALGVGVAGVSVTDWRGGTGVGVGSAAHAVKANDSIPHSANPRRRDGMPLRPCPTTLPTAFR